MVSLGMSLKAMPGGLSWRHWPEGGSCCDAPEWGLGFRPTSLSEDWVEAAKERGALGMGAPIHSLTHSFILSNQEVLGIVPGGGETAENRASASQPGGKTDALKYHYRAVGWVLPQRGAGYHPGREGSRKASLVRGYLRQDKVLQGVWARRKSIAGRGNSMCKGPGGTVSKACSGTEVTYLLEYGIGPHPRGSDDWAGTETIRWSWGRDSCSTVGTLSHIWYQDAGSTLGGEGQVSPLPLGLWETLQNIWESGESEL